jgi:hypothetical protein
MTIAIRFVEPTHVNQAWPLVEGFLADAFTKGNDFPDWAANYTVEHVRAFVTGGSWLLIVAVNEKNEVQGACTVSFINYPLHRVAFVTAIGGKLISNQDTFAQLKQILKQHGATKIQGYGRESIVRLWKRYDFEPRNTLVEVLI